MKCGMRTSLPVSLLPCLFLFSPIEVFFQFINESQDNICYIAGEPTDPSFVTKPKSLVANTVMLNSEKFTCAAGVGYPAGQGQTVLQTNKDGIFKTFNLGEQSTTVSEDTCFINETLEVKAVTFEMSLNNTQLRCAFENDEGNTRYSEEYTIQLLQGN